MLYSPTHGIWSEASAQEDPVIPLLSGRMMLVVLEDRKVNECTWTGVLQYLTKYFFCALCAMWRQVM